MRPLTLLVASLLLLPTLMHAVPASPAEPASAGLGAADGLEASPVVATAPAGTGGLPVDMPFVVDEAGDTIEGDLAVTGTLTVNGQVTVTAPLAMPGGHGILFDGGRLGAQGALTFDGRAVCVADGSEPGCGVRDGSITLAKLAFDPATQQELDDAVAGLQQRVTGSCADGSSIRSIGQDGSVACEVDTDTDTVYTDAMAIAAVAGDGFVRSTSLAAVATSGAFPDLLDVPAGLADGDDDTTYTAGTGLTLAGAAFSADTTVLQQRVTGSCADGSSIRSIGQDGSVACEVDTDTDTDTTYSAGDGLTLSGTTFSVAQGGIATGHLAFDPATQSELDSALAAERAESDQRYALAGGDATFDQVALTGTPTDPSHAATKAYVDAQAPSGAFRRASATAVQVPFNQWVTLVTMTAAQGKELVDLTGGSRGGSHGEYRVKLVYTDGTSDTGPKVGSSFSGGMWFSGLMYGSKSSGNPNWAYDPFPNLASRAIHQVVIEAYGGGSGATSSMDAFLYAREV